jgi:large subunit ribosomal protein L19
MRVGDTVRVNYLIKEGDKERIQPFTGIVIALQGRGIARNAIVRRLVQGEGVERIFPLHSPRVKDIEVVRRGKVRRAKLYFLRDRVGKQTRVDELLGERARRLADGVPSDDSAATAPEAPAQG